MNPASTHQDIRSLLEAARNASYQMAVMTTEQKNAALETFASLLESHKAELLAANQKDLALQEGQISSSMLQRLKLDDAKLAQLVQGIRDVVGLADPVGRVLSKTKLDNGLVLEKVSVPLGVITIIFESRPDVLPQIVSLILKSGNAVVFKGGKEAYHSNHAFMSVVDQLAGQCPGLPQGWAQLVDAREAVQEILNYPELVDLVIPRGSNQLVQSIMAATKIPVLGHADGVCHLYVHNDADLQKAMLVIIDAKAQYPAACNALETLLVDASIASTFLPAFAEAAQGAKLQLKGCEATRKILPQLEPADEADWRAEYGDLTLAVKIVSSMDDAIAHINHYGSHHTDGILTESAEVAEQFLNRVDSAGVFWNASTRFADGFRYGFGAEIGISTAKTHARGPVGMDGLVIYKYKLRGDGHVVKDYVGEAPKRFLHEPC